VTRRFHSPLERTASPSGELIFEEPLSATMRENQGKPEDDFDLWKIDRDATEETHQAEFALK
jgi:hypothetical protein